VKSSTTTIIPFIIDFMESMGISLIVTFGVSSVLVIVLSLGLPETLGIPLSEMIEKLKYEHNDSSN
jgi:hypothetical protein